MNRYRFPCVLTAIAVFAFLQGALVQAQVFQELFSNSIGSYPYGSLTLGGDGCFYGTTSAGGMVGKGTVFKVTPSGEVTTLVNFNSTNGANPQAGLTLGADGDLYGTTYQGGVSDYGTVFKVTSGGVLTTLVRFNYASGGCPGGWLTQGSDGNFYGTTALGGASGGGTIFKMTPGGTLTTLVSFDSINGGNPQSGLTLGSDGNFYGTTYGGGGDNGTVFQVTPTGVLTTLTRFNRTNGSNPYGGVTFGSDGNLYGATVFGGPGNAGTVFKVTRAGVLTTLVSFNGGNGTNPYGRVTLGSDGNFYGMTSRGGSSNYGTVFKMTPSGGLTTLLSFGGGNGSGPHGDLAQGSDGNFYGTTTYGGTAFNGTIFKVTPGGILTTLASYNLTCGANPRAGLTQGSDGNFYGTTDQGGTSDYGTVFEFMAGGKLTTLANFDYYSNGASPNAGLTEGSDGAFYGTAASGGVYTDGTVFKVSPGGPLATLVNFNENNGNSPSGDLKLGSDGNFYGVTAGGGWGVIFKMTPNGELTTLVNFNVTNGSIPYGALTIGSDGNFYGTTGYGGTNNYGTVFKMTPAGELTTLVNFNSSNGATPYAGVTLGGDGNFYGTTYSGGTSNQGTVFCVTPGGDLTTLVNFDSSNGANPHGGLTQGSDGNFYGTTFNGGASGYGTVFQVTQAGELTTLYAFDGLTSANPQCAPIFGTDGNLYGTANQMVIWKIVFVPSVSTGTASNIGLGGAAISGTVAPDKTDATVVFEYGTDVTYGATTAATPGTVSATSTATSVSATLIGLSPHTLYHYRVDATNNAGATQGADATFTTANTPPTAGTSTASLNTGDTTTITLPFATTDADGDTVTVQSISASSGAPFTLGTLTGNTVPVTASLNAAGIGTINFTVTDGFGGTADGSVAVTVVDSLPPVFTSVPSDITVEAPVGTSGAVVNYSTAVATDNVGGASLTVNYPSGSTFPIGQTVVQYTAVDAAGNTAHASFSVTVRSGDVAADALGIKGTAVAGGGVPAGATWSGFGVPCATSSGDAFFTATLKAGKVTNKDIVLLDGATGDVSALVQTGSAVSGLTGATFSVFKDPLAVSMDGGQEVVVYLATIAGKGVTPSNNQVVVRNWVNNGAITKTDLLGQSRMTVDVAGAKVAKFTSLGLGADGTVWASVSLAPGSGHVTASNNISLLGWAPGATAPAEVLRKGTALTLGDGKKHLVSTIATLASTSGSPGQGRWEGPEGLLVRVGFVDGTSAIMTTTSGGTLTEVARTAVSVTLLISNGTLEMAGGQWGGFGLPAVDLGGGTTFKATLATNIGGVTNANATGVFRQEGGSSQWTPLVRTGDSTGLPDQSHFLGFSDPVSNAAGTVGFVATQLAGKVKTTGLWTSSPMNLGLSASRVLTQIVAVHGTAPETGGALFASFVSVAMPEWENAGPLFVATLQAGPAGTASHGKVTAANKTGLWGVDFNGDLRLLLRAALPLPGAAAGSPVVKTFSVLQAVPGSTGQSRAVDGQYEVFCNVTYANGTTAVVKVQVP